MGKRAVLFGAAIVSAAILVVAGVRLASAGEDADATTLLDRVAAKLGVEPDRLEQAFREARDEEIDERVQDGDLSQEQADRLKERLDEMPPEGEWAPFPGGRGPGSHPWMEKLHGAFGLGLGLIDGASALADFLGVDEAGLMRELAGGESLATVAEANGKSRDELKAFIVSEANVRIDEAVESGLIPEDRADELRSKLNERLDDVIDGRLPEFKWDFRFRGGVPFHRGGGHDGPNPDTQQGYSSPGSSTRS
jgi:ribosomal protein S20